LGKQIAGVEGALAWMTGGTLRRVVRFLCFVSVFMIFLFFGGAFSAGSAEPGRSDGQPAIRAVVSSNSTSSNSSSGTIMITMTGMAGDPGDISGR